MEQEIFFDKILNCALINANYRGLVGFPTDSDDEVQGLLILGLNDEFQIIDFDNGEAMTDNYFERGSVWVREFITSEIPVGELVWVQDTAYDEIELKPFDVSMPSNCSIIVPHLIANSAEEAEKLKDWDRN